jgi:hypothetical protein
VGSTVVKLIDWGWQHSRVSGDGATIWFLFSASRKGRARTFRIVVGLSRLLLRSSGWNLAREKLAVHAFAYAQEQLERCGLPDGDALRLTLTTRIEGGRFADGPPWVTDDVALDGAFVTAHGFAAASVPRG